MKLSKSIPEASAREGAILTATTLESGTPEWIRMIRSNRSQPVRYVLGE